MIGRILRALRAAVIGGGVLAVLSIGSGAGAQAIATTDATAHPVSSGAQPSAAAVKAHWTPAAMRSARVATKSLSGSAKANARSVIVAHGTATAFAPKAPTAGPAVAHVAAGSGATPSGGGVAPQNFPGTDAYDYPPPASNVGALTDLGVPITQFPWAPNGALFFHDPVGGGDFRCSAGIINSQNLSVLFTAGHCVANGGRNYFYTNFAFCPAYDATLAAPCQLGTLTARQAWTWSTWLTNGILAVDLGALVLNCTDGQPGDPFGNCSAGGIPAVTLTGGEGIAFNQSVVQHFWNIGYPAALPYNGCCMDLSTASSNHLDPNQGSPSTIGIGSNFTGGSSGGQWYTSFGSGGGFANGHNDYIYTAQPLQMFSPYYGNEALAVYNAAATS